MNRWLAAVGCVFAGCGGTLGEVQPDTPAEPEPIVAAHDGPSLDYGVTRARFESGDETDEEGRSIHDYFAHLDTGTRVRLWVTSTTDTMLEVRGTGGLHLECDDFIPGAIDPLIEFEAREGGVYEIRVRTFAPGETGEYSLGLIRVDPRSGHRLVDGSDESATFHDGAKPGIENGYQYWLELQAGERLHIRVTAGGLNSNATLIGPSGDVWSNDNADDPGSDRSESIWDSTLLIAAPEDGIYRLVIASYGANEIGSFRVRAEIQPPVVLAPGRGPAVGFAGRGGNGRLLGLFIGLSTYPSQQLYGCADDATLLARAFIERGLMSEADQRVLVDTEATTASVRESILWLASESTSDDVVFIFFSGFARASNALEDTFDIDGTDEEIVLFDGAFRDHEFAALLDGITSDLLVLALDTARAAGFSRDFMTRPGRIGLFSSGEDVISNTAETLRAGGYLSYALRRAILGHADAMPHDGVLLAGELTDFLLREFIANADRINAPGSSEPMQWIESDRGSTRWQDLLFFYPRAHDGSLLPTPNVRLESPAQSSGAR